LDVEDKESLTRFSFLVSAFGLDVVVSSLSDFTFNGSFVGVALESSWESSENPNDWSDGVLNSQWDSEALRDSEDQVTWVFDNKTNGSFSGSNNAVSVSVIWLDFKDDLF
jgi:hypothetical protein